MMPLLAQNDCLGQYLGVHVPFFPGAWTLLLPDAVVLADVPHSSAGHRVAGVPHYGSGVYSQGRPAFALLVSRPVPAAGAIAEETPASHQIYDPPGDSAR